MYLEDRSSGAQDEAVELEEVFKTAGNTIACRSRFGMVREDVLFFKAVSVLYTVLQKDFMSEI